jgi:hypothetical protein
LNLRKAFENRRDRLWRAFKIVELALAGIQNCRVGSGRLSKSAIWLLPTFKIGKLFLADIQNRQVGSGWLSKSASWLWPASRRCSEKSVIPIGAKDLNSPVLKKLFSNSKSFHAKRPRIN